MHRLRQDDAVKGDGWTTGSAERRNSVGRGKYFFPDDSIGQSAQKVGMVFQYPEYQLFAQTVEKDVGFGLKYSRLSREEKQERVRWALEQMGFSYEEIKDQSPLSLSGGEKRRVAIAGVWRQSRSS